MMMGYGDASFYGFHVLAWIFWIALIGFAVWLIVRRTGNGGPPPKSARQILDERYARGEIDSAEYEERRRRIEGRAAGSSAGGEAALR